MHIIMKTQQQTLLEIQMTEVHELRRQISLYSRRWPKVKSLFGLKKKWTLGELFKIIDHNNNQLIVEDCHECVLEKVFDNIEKAYQAAIRDINENVLNNVDNATTRNARTWEGDFNSDWGIWKCGICKEYGFGKFKPIEHQRLACAKYIRNTFGAESVEYHRGVWYWFHRNN